MSKVSILVPAYNASTTISETMDSLQQQTVLERVQAVYLADDGSSDDTVSLAQTGWTNRAPLQVLASDHNLGQWPDVNRAMLPASVDDNDWVLMLHSDDVAKPSWLELNLAAIAVCEIGCCRDLL